MLQTSSTTDQDTPSDDKSDSSSDEPIIDFSTIQLQDLINKGRYGSVYRGISPELNVELGVKIYKPDAYKYYFSERKIFTLKNMDQEHLLKFLGSKEVEREEEASDDPTSPSARKNNLRKEYWLVTRLMPRGSLNEFLKSNTVDWNGFLKMGYSVCNGLAFLHSPVKTECKDMK